MAGINIDDDAVGQMQSDTMVLRSEPSVFME